MNEENPTINKQWFQTESHVRLVIMGKHSKEDCSVKFDKDEVAIQAKFATGQLYSVNIKLSKNIDPDRSSYKLFETKLELSLGKIDGERWDTLERAVVEIPKTTTSQERNWDKLVKEMTKDDDESDVNTLFRKIYSEGSDEVRKAMNKSFLESGGTVLSTNWKDVRKDKVEIKPPEGMEWKKWDE